MFKAPAPALRRSLSLYSHAARSAARDGHAASFTVVPVRISRPPLSRSRLFGALTISAATFALGQSLGIFDEPTDAHHDVPRRGEWTNVGPSAAPHDADDQAATRILFFLPTGFPQPQERVKYKLSDPELQEHRAFAADRERMLRLRDGLARVLRKWLMDQPSYARRFGQIDLARGTIYFHVTLPDGPPLEYDQSGIALTQDLELCTATRVLDHTQYSRLSALYHPEAVFRATLRELKRKTVRTWKHVTLFMTGNTPVKPEPIQAMLEPLSAKPFSPTATAASPDRSSNQLATDRSEPQSPSSPGLTNILGAAHSKTEIQLPDFREFLGESKTISTLLDFHAPIEAPRGSVIVKGLVQVVGSRDSGLVEAAFCYNVKENRIVMFKMNPVIKTYREVRRLS
jgi:hypothetical protein